MLAILGVPANAVTGQSSQPCFSISLSTPQSVVKSGFEVKAEVTLRIIRTCSFSWDWREAEFYYTIDVRDSNGNPPPESNYSKVIKGTYTGRPEHIFVNGRLGVESMAQPGRTRTDDLYLDNLYDLSPPGSYTVQVSRSDGESKTRVKSNTVTITNWQATANPINGTAPNFAGPFFSYDLAPPVVDL